jgi:phosphatidylserine decarboxylase
MKIDVSELPKALELYETLGDIFARTLKEGCRSIEDKDNPHTMVQQLKFLVLHEL